MISVSPSISESVGIRAIELSIGFTISFESYNPFSTLDKIILFISSSPAADFILKRLLSVNLLSLNDSELFDTDSLKISPVAKGIKSS